MNLDIGTIRKLQKEKRISGADLAHALSITPSSLSVIKSKGKTTKCNAIILARALGVELKEIVKKEG